MEKRTQVASMALLIALCAQLPVAAKIASSYDPKTATLTIEGVVQRCNAGTPPIKDLEEIFTYPNPNYNINRTSRARLVGGPLPKCSVYELKEQRVLGEKPEEIASVQELSFEEEPDTAF